MMAPAWVRQRCCVEGDLSSLTASAASIVQALERMSQFQELLHRIYRSVRLDDQRATLWPAPPCRSVDLNRRD